ncbi:MAG: transketolase [Eubacteriales bacterium]|nr:transketolase [Eubacteriales bacterium]
MADKQTIDSLKEKAYEMRKMLVELCCDYTGNIHIGGDLSMTEMLIALYHYAMNVDPKDIKMPTRDRFILSKGHGAAGMYIAMALRGFFDYDTIFKTYGKLDSAFGMHPCKVQLPGVESSSGSLGQGLAIAVGMAASARQKGQKHRVYCLMGDGETCEGEVWEAALSTSSFGLGNLVGIVDRNKLMMTNTTEDNIVMEPYADKWRAFGWDVVEFDGNDMEQVVAALDNVPDTGSSKPVVLLSHTVKGKGVSFMENTIGWHAGSLNTEQAEKALLDIEESYGRGNA